MRNTVIIFLFLAYGHETMAQSDSVPEATEADQVTSYDLINGREVSEEVYDSSRAFIRGDVIHATEPLFGELGETYNSSGTSMTQTAAQIRRRSSEAVDRSARCVADHPFDPSQLLTGS